ncbi:malectin domain-containing carbohydrate-binding protein [Paenibacillus sp. GCM10027626]|uniref:malectin domain-containing carbohydrate-binding protein n=1 Tax=Paenibacillus sp. GCM10027626 TaxID=3273411 RepID=UPI00362C76CD
MSRKLFRFLMALILILALIAPAMDSASEAEAASLGSTIYVFDLDQYRDTADRTDWYDMELFVSTLQGIVNQQGPRLYIRNHKFGAPFGDVATSEYNSINTYWLDKFTQRGQWLSEATVTTLSTIEDLVSTFNSTINGLILWDPKVDATVNVATTMAGYEGAPIVMAGGNLYNRLVSAPNNLAVKTGCSCNLTIANGGGPFSGANAKTDAYTWAKTNYLDTGKVNAGLLGFIEDGFVRQPGSINPQSFAVERDYLVKNKGFAFDLSPWGIQSVDGNEKPGDAPNEGTGTSNTTISRDREVLLSILQSAYSIWGQYWPIEMIGFIPWWDKYSSVGNRGSHDPVFGEWKSVEEFSKYNVHITSAIDTLGYGNASFHSWAPIGTGLKNMPQSPARPVLGTNKTYVLFYMGDHDGGMLHQSLPYIWEDKGRGKYPLAWGVVPNMIRDYPDIAQYMYDTATPNDYFYAGSSGAGYANPSFLPSLDNWTTWSELLYKRAGMTMSGFINNGNAGAPNNTIEQSYSKYSADGITVSAATGTPAVRNGNMAVITNNLGVDRYDLNSAAATIYNVTSALTNPGGQNNFLTIRSSFASPSFINDLYEKMQADHPSWNYEVVDPYSFYSLIRQATTSNANDGIVLSVDMPEQMVAGYDYDVNVTLRNVGSTTWTMGTNDRFGASTSNQFIWKNLNGGYSIDAKNQRVFLSPGESIAPQGTKKFTFTITAPATTGTYTFSGHMVRDGATWVGTPYTRSIPVVAASGDQAIVTSVSVPIELAEGTTGAVSVTVKNVGSTTWTAAGNYRLGSIPAYDLDFKKSIVNSIIWTGSSGWGFSNSETNQRAFLAAEESIAPGSSKTFVFSVQAPAKRGEYVFSGRMVKDGTAWFGPTFEKEIMVVPSVRTGLDAALINSAAVPVYMPAGSTRRVTISLKNVGTETWTLTGNYRLGATAANEFKFSNFKDGGSSTSATNQRVYLNAEDSIAPESVKSFTFDITAPTAAGMHTFSVDMIHEGTGWANQAVSFNVNVTNATNDAAFTSDNIPLQMAAGSQHSVEVEVVNRGSWIWNSSANYRLGTPTGNDFSIVKFNDGGYSSGAANQRVFLNNNDSIRQGDKKMFRFDLQAPTAPNTYNLVLRMVQDGVSWFGDTKTISIQVVSPKVYRVNAGGSGFTDAGGRAWVADQAYSSVQGYGYTGTTATGSTANTVTVVDSDNDDFPTTLFQSERHGSSFGYQFDVPNGTYRVRLAFAELANTQSYQRQFSLQAEGNDILSGYDIYKMVYDRIAGGQYRGQRFEFTVDVADGQLNLDFNGQTGDALVNGIEVERLY